MTRQERYQKLVEAIGQAIYHQSWLGKYWGRTGAIALAKARCFYLIGELEKTERDVLSAFSSTYYSAAGNAWARAKEAKQFGSLMFLFWLWPAWRCLRQAIQRSDELEKVAGGLKNLTPDELDIRSSIMFKAGRWEKAGACANIGLQKVGISDNTRCLLLLNFAKVQEKLGGEDSASEAYRQAYDLKEKLPPETQARLLRALASRADGLGHEDKAKQWREEARAIALLNGLTDQLAKLNT